MNVRFVVSARSSMVAVIRAVVVPSAVMVQDAVMMGRPELWSGWCVCYATTYHTVFETIIVSGYSRGLCKM